MADEIRRAPSRPAVLPPRPGAGSVPPITNARALRAARDRQAYQAAQIHELRVLNDAARFVSQKLEAQGLPKATYDAEGTFGSNLQDFINAADLTRSRTLGDRINKFKDAYPKGQIMFVPVGDDSITLVRKSPTEPFRKLGLGGKIVGTLISEPVIAGAAVGWATAGWGTLPAIAATGAATGLAEYGQSEVERARGFESRSRRTAGTEAFVTGSVTSLTDLLVRGVFGRVLPVAALGRQAREVRLAQEFAEREGLPPLMAGQVTPNPSAQAAFGQAARADPLIMERAAEQQARSLELLRTRVGRTSLTDAEVESTLQGLVSSIDQNLSNITPATKTEAGLAIQRGMDDYRQGAFGEGGLFSKRYQPLIEQSEDFAYNIAALKQEANRISMGTPAKGMQTRGKTGQFEAGELVRMEGPLHPKLKAVVDDLNKLPDVISGFQEGQVSFAATEQLRALRTRLFDLKMELTDFGDQQTAAKLHRMVADLMKNPMTGNKLVAQRFAKVGEQYEAAEQLLERSYVRRALASDEPEKLLSYVAPGNFTAMSEMKQIMRPEGWEVVKNNFVSDLAQDPSKIQAALAEWKRDPEGLRLLITQQDEQALYRLSDLWEQMGMDVLNVSLKRGTAPERRAIQLIKADEESIAATVARDGGPDGPVGTALRSVLIEDLLKKATMSTKYGEVLNFNLFTKELAKAQGLRKNDIFMRPDDWVELQNLDRYMRFSNAVDASNVGASLQVAEEVASGVKGLVPTAKGAKRLAKFAHFILRQGAMARTMARPAARRGLAAAEAAGRRNIEGLAIAGAIATRDIMSSLGLETIEEVERLGERGEMDVERVKVTE